MPPIWDTHYGFIRKMNGPATVVGEWGGQMSGKDEQWMNAYANYLISQDIPDQVNHIYLHVLYIMTHISIIYIVLLVFE